MSRTSRSTVTPATKSALLEAAERLFSNLGYAGTSLDAVAAEAQVTKGALYHHFEGKQALFEAVLVNLEHRAADRVNQAISREADPWTMVVSGLQAYMSVASEPAYRRVVIQDGPAALGYERYRAQEERGTLATITGVSQAVLEAGGWDPEDPMVEIFSRVFHGAVAAAGQAVADSPDPVKTRAEAEVAITFLLRGVQSLVESGDLPSAELAS